MEVYLYMLAFYPCKDGLKQICNRAQLVLSSFVKRRQLSYVLAACIKNNSRIFNYLLGDCKQSRNLRTGYSVYRVTQYAVNTENVIFVDIGKGYPYSTPSDARKFGMFTTILA